MKKLNKFISDSGYCSRREADRYIVEGRVTVNNIDAEVAQMIEDGDLVEVDGERVGRKPKKAIYIAFNKPEGVTSTTDTEDKRNIVDFIGYKERIFHVGRLDKDSEGLIILTNDGDIVNKILRAGNNNPKEYIVTVDKPITAEFISKMSQGVPIFGAMTKPCKIIKKNEVTFIAHLTQGLNRQIRRMCEVLGYKVKTLKRIKVMNIALGDLEVGRWRYFTPDETSEMMRLLEKSSGTEEASKIKTARVGWKSGGKYSDYRKKSGAKRSDDGKRDSWDENGEKKVGLRKVFVEGAGSGKGAGFGRGSERGAGRGYGAGDSSGSGRGYGADEGSERGESGATGFKRDGVTAERRFSRTAEWGEKGPARVGAGGEKGSSSQDKRPSRSSAHKGEGSGMGSKAGEGFRRVEGAGYGRGAERGEDYGRNSGRGEGQERGTGRGEGSSYGRGEGQERGTGRGSEFGSGAMRNNTARSGASRSSASKNSAERNSTSRNNDGQSSAGRSSSAGRGSYGASKSGMKPASGRGKTFKTSSRKTK